MQDEWNFVKVIHLGLKLHRGKKYIQFDLYTKSMQLHFYKWIDVAIKKTCKNC